ncbi:MAG: redoxin family protein [Bdellovibrionales bacterium]
MKTWSILTILSLLTFQAAAAVGGQDLLSGKTVEVIPGKLGTVVVFMSAKCPCSNSHIGIVKKLAADFKEYNFVAVHSNSDESVEQAKSYFKSADLGFPVIEDRGDKLADEFKANRTPDAFLIAANGETIFKGGVTNSHEGETAEKHYLRDALSEVKAGQPVKVAQARTLGCAISRNSNVP